MRILKFPEDFTGKPHRVVPGAYQWLFEYNNTDEMISIVGGGSGLWGDGITTFEMWDTKNMDEPEGHMTTDGINQWLNDHPVE
jgi:hypothetical protein